MIRLCANCRTQIQIPTKWCQDCLQSKIRYLEAKIETLKCINDPSRKQSKRCIRCKSVHNTDKMTCNSCRQRQIVRQKNSLGKSQTIENPSGIEIVPHGYKMYVLNDDTLKEIKEKVIEATLFITRLNQTESAKRLDISTRSIRYYLLKKG